MIRTLLITDTETTGLDPAKDRCIEVAIARYDVPSATVLETYTSLIYAEENAAADINRIPAGTLRLAPSQDHVWRQVLDVVLRAGAQSVFVAHRAEFDRGFYPKAHGDLLPWVCSKLDIEWPKSKLGDHLVNVALAHGVPVHDNHRALTDVMLLARTFTACAERGIDLQAMLARAMRPKAHFVSMAPFEEKDTVKAHGFSWNPTARVWERRMCPEDVAALPFRVREVQP